MIRKILSVSFAAMILAGCPNEDDNTGVVRLTNATASKSITYFKYKRHSEPSWTGSSDLLPGGYYLPPGGSQDYELALCDTRLDFAAGSLAGLFGEVVFSDHVVPCGGRLELKVTD